jgi:hypothetical protein
MSIESIANTEGDENAAEPRQDQTVLGIVSIDIDELGLYIRKGPYLLAIPGLFKFAIS